MARRDQSRPVAAPKRAGGGVCQGAALPVSARQKLEQVFDQCHSNKFSKQVFDSVFQSVCQNFQPNLGNFQPNPKLFQPNPDRIFTNLFFNRILNWFVASSGVTRSVSSS
jgi:hypothetical protein